MSRARSTLASAFALVLLASCGTTDARRPSAARLSPPASPVVAAVGHRDTRLGVPSFAWLSASGTRFAGAAEAAAASLTGIASAFGLAPDALGSVSSPEVHDLGRGPIVARFRQRVGGVEVFRGGLSVLMTRSFEPVAASGLLAPSTTGADEAFAHDAASALAAAYALVTGGATVAFAQLDLAGDYTRFGAPDLEQPARVKKVLFPKRGPSGVTLEPAYRVELMLRRGAARSLVISARDRKVLFQNDLVRNDAFTYRVYANPQTLLPFDGPQGNAAAPHPTGRPDGSKPSFVPSQLVTLQNYPFSKNDPWLLPGATSTSGNNVEAFADLAEPDGFSLGADLAASLTGPKTFDHAYDTGQSPSATPASIQAAVTQLFYVTNFLHDWFYDAGFDEKSGNPQFDNFGRGGAARDAIRAEAQDYSGRNNANAATPADGASPRIQMYVFSGPSNAEISVASPPAVAGVKPVGIAGFGKDAFEVTGPVVLANDEQGSDPNDACEPLAASAAGKIVLVHRGLCSFVQKVQNVQAAGGLGVVIANVPTSASPSTPPYMGGTTGDVNIPVLSLSLADGQALEAQLGAGVTLTMKRSHQTDLDGSLDTSIVVHEWGHVLSNRLVADGDGLTTNQAGGLGEGWSDFVALLLMARPEDLGTSTGAGWAGAYSNGAYATSGGGADFYFGIRRVPYSVDFTKNALTFAHIQNGTPLPATMPVSFGEDGSFNAEVHNAGEVWATMLWECYVALLRDPRHSFVQAQERMKRYLVAGLKLTPPDPTLLEARDALLAAAFAEDQQDFRLFWEAFARRGAGVGAEGPPKDSSDNVGVKESTLVGNDVQIVQATLVDDVISCDKDGFLDEGEVGTVQITVRNAGAGALSATTAQLSSTSPGVTFEGDGRVALGPMKPFEVATAKLQATVRGARKVEPFRIDVAVTDPSLAVARTVTLAVPARFETDEAPESATVDTVDTKGTSWKVTGDDTYGTSKEWSRTREGSNAWWTIPDVPDPGDHKLTSPRFTIEGRSFGLSFRHRWSFRFSSRRKVDLHGGVIEVSTDGKTWRDVGDFAKTDYNTVLSPGRGDNVLGGRRAYGNKSPGYPDAWVTSKLQVTLDEEPKAVQIRFRTAAGTTFSGAPGWEIDDIELTGVTSAPFWSFVAHADQCDENGPTVDAGAARTVMATTPVTLVGTGAHPAEAPLTFVWTQESGPEVELAPEGATLSFVAPVVTEDTVLRFALRAHDGSLLSPASRVDVTVTPLTRALTVGGGCSAAPSTSPVWVGAGGAALALAAAVARRRRRPR